MRVLCFPGANPFPLARATQHTFCPQNNYPIVMSRPVTGLASAAASASIGDGDHAEPVPQPVAQPPRAATRAPRLTLVAALRGMASTISTVLGTLYAASRDLA